MNGRNPVMVAAAGRAAADSGIRRSAKSDSAEPFFPSTPSTTHKDGMPCRQLGRTDETVSLLGLGGFHIGLTESEAESTRLIRTAVDNGLTFMDNCWDYHEGLSEIRMGRALRDGYRNKVFLMSKIDGRDRKTAGKQIDESLLRLQTDRLDLVQFHEVIRLEEPDLIFARDGALEAVLKAREEGKVRYIGFTGHKDPLVHLRMLDMAEANGFRFDTVQMPLNVMDVHFRSFQNQVLPRLVREETGALGMKSMGAGVILRSNLAKPTECLHYAMTLPVSVVITGIESLPILNQALKAARGFSPLTQAQLADLLNRTRRAAKKGAYELFKTTATFDATARNPHWLGAVERVPT